jgi:carbonic anhydrase
LKLIKEKYSTLLEQNPDDSSQISKLCELNVIEQVYNVCSTNIVLNAWKRNQPLTIHGWIYDIKDGLLQDLGVCIANYTELQNSTKTDITKFFNLKSH